MCHRWLKSSADGGIIWQSCYFRVIRTTQLILNDQNQRQFFSANKSPYSKYIWNKSITLHEAVPLNTLIHSLVNLIQYMGQFYTIWWMMLWYTIIPFSKQLLQFNSFIVWDIRLKEQHWQHCNWYCIKTQSHSGHIQCKNRNNLKYSRR